MVFNNHCMVVNNSLLAESRCSSRQKKKEKRDRETPAGRRRVVSYNRRPHLWTKPTGFENQFRLTWNACGLLRWNIGDFWPNRCYWPNRFCKLCHTWLKRNWLFRKHQYMLDRNTHRGQEEVYLFPIIFLSLWEAFVRRKGRHVLVF